MEGYTKAFATYLGEHGDVRLAVVGSDTRATSDDYRRRVTEALLATGWDVIDLGVVPTPTAQIAVAGLNAAGGVVVTASHNPARYNGLKLLRNEGGHGLFLHKEQAENVFAIYDDKRFATGPRGHYRHVRELARALEAPDYVGEYLRGVGGPAVDNGVALNYHLHRVVTAMGEDVGAIRARNLRVVMDCCGGAGSPIDYALLAHLHTRLTRVNEAPGVFTREIEPTPENLRDLCDRLGNDSDTYDVGFVTDCDNDRCVLVGWHPDAGRYEPLEEDYTLAIAVDQALRAFPSGSTVVTNWGTSQMIKDIASRHHANLRRVPTGEVYTASDALTFRAVIAGEGSCGGVIDPRVGMGRDTLVAIWHTLARLAYSGKSLYAIQDGYPKYWKCNRDLRVALPAAEVRALLERLQVFYASKPDLAFMSREDGLIVALQDHSRIQVRASNTEPLLRVRCASPNEARAVALADELVACVDGVTSLDKA